LIGCTCLLCISGFLITGLLLGELAATDRIRLRRFYLRRTLRIFPPYYVFIGSLVLAQTLGWLVLSAGDAAQAVTDTSNYARRHDRLLKNLRLLKG
jgi:peptidoglycan/LPS O-acetylase OafA/YrhL